MGKHKDKNGIPFHGIPNKETLERLAEMQNFKQLVIIAYLNRLAVLTDVEGAFMPVEKAESPEAVDEHIVYDTRPDFCTTTEDGIMLCPIVTEMMQDEEHGLNATECADTRYGSKYVTFRAVIQEGETPYIVCECAGLDMHIVIEGGRWYADVTK